MRILPVLLLALVAVGCQQPPVSQTATVADLLPEAIAPSAATLTFDKVEVPVTLEASREGEWVALNWAAYGETLETERYRRTEDSFGLVESLRETYEPPLPLIGPAAAKPWVGTMTSAGVVRKASATITGRSEALDVLGKPATAHVVRAEMRIGDDPALAIERSLIFWFVPGQGLVQRQFGEWSTRKPRAAEPTP